MAEKPLGTASEPPLAVVVVRNTATHDARVLRSARTLQSMGYRAQVLAVTSDEERGERVTLEGVPVVRLTPSAVPFAHIVGKRNSGSEAGPDAAKGERGTGAGSGAGRGRGPLTHAYRLLRTLDYYRRGISAMRALRPEIVHCNDYNTMWIGIGAKLMAGSALVYDSHELWADRNGRREPRRWLLLCEALFVRVADRLLATSPGHAEAIARRYRVAAPRVVRNIPERRPVHRNSGGGGAARRTIAYAGAVTTHRGLEQAIAALSYAPGIELRVVGPGTTAYRAGLTRLAAERGVAERVHFEDPVPPGQVAEAIAGAAAGLALIQPACLSYYLSLPNKLFEYTAAGLPILAADVPVIRSFVEENAVGIVVAPDDPREIGQAMLEIAAPQRNRELRGAVARAAKGLSWQAEAETLKAAYREAKGAAGAKR